MLASLVLLAQVVTLQFTAKLTDSGDNPPIAALPSDATEPAEALTPAFHVATPNAQAPRMMNIISPAIAIPYNSRIRQIEAFWNGTPLPLIDPRGTQLTEEAHTFGSMIPFFKPLFSLTGIPAGNGTLEIRAFDASHAQLASISIPNLTVVRPPPPIPTATIAAMPHPRIYLPSRLGNIRGRNDVAAQRFNEAVTAFNNALLEIPDVTSTQFSDRIYDPEDYIPLLELPSQICRAEVCDPPDVRAQRLSSAAHALTMRIANDYDTGKRDFGRDTGYDIRYGLRDLMLAYDWGYNSFTPAERAVIVRVATKWIDWYHTTPGYAESWPAENYYAGYLQGIALVAVATAGDNPDADRIFALLRSKLANEVPILNQRLPGGDWAEGWNYGWYSTLEYSLVNTLLKDIGEDWSSDFDWLQPLPRSLTYMVSPDFSEMRPYGGYSGDYPHRTSPATLAVLSSTTTDGAYASRLYTAMNANPNNDFTDIGGDRFYEVIFADTTKNPNIAALPLSYLNTGTGRWFSRSSLTDPQAYFVSAENTSYSFDHYGYANGDVRLYHGTTCLVCPAAYRGPSFEGEAVTPAFSTFLVNGRVQGLVLGRNNQILFTIENGNFAAIGMRFESSWASSRFDENIVDPANAVDYIIREAVHLRPGTLIVRDLHRRRHATDTLSSRFHVGDPDKLNIVNTPPAPVFTDDRDGAGNRIGTLMQLNFPSSTQPINGVTVFSETLTVRSYDGSVLTLSDGTRVIFANGSVSVQTGSVERRRAVRR
ncbi:MAG: DUF4962 domain-containing protein [Acidobacteriota bacterium]|nr:DUF4962 domain-containing protein [Acidobacteriota bacterium]